MRENNAGRRRQIGDLVGPNLRALIVAINPSTRSASIGHSFSSRGNPFWRCLFESGLTPVQLDPRDEHRLLDFGLGLVSTVQRGTPSAATQSLGERRAGATHHQRSTLPPAPARRAARTHAAPSLISGGRVTRPRTTPPRRDRTAPVDGLAAQPATRSNNPRQLRRPPPNGHRPCRLPPHLTPAGRPDQEPQKITSYARLLDTVLTR
jgi:hypothetical protein